MRRELMLIGDERVETGEWFPVYDKFSGTLVAEAPVAKAEHVKTALAGAREALPELATLTVDERMTLLEEWATALEAQKEWFVEVMLTELGRTVKCSHLFFDLAVSIIRSYREYLIHTYGDLDKVLAPRPAYFPEDKGRTKTYYLWDPKGVAALIVPSNAPFMLTIEKVTPLILAGNTVVVKAASQAPSATLRMIKLLKEVGAPSGAVNVLSGGGRDLNQNLVSDPNTDVIQFIGQAAHGPALEALAAQSHKDFMGEYEGNDWVYVRADADTELAAREIVNGFTNNAGQMCMHIQGVLVDKQVAPDLITGLSNGLSKIKLGNPRDWETDIGPSINLQISNYVLRQLEEACQQGAELLAGGKIEGSFFLPTIVRGAKRDSRLVNEESFAPVIWVNEVAGDKEALDWLLTNEHRLTCTIFTKDEAEGERLARQLRFGRVVINADPTITYHPFLPWGGLGISGRGGLIPWIEQYTNKKFVEVVKTP